MQALCQSVEDVIEENKNLIYSVCSKYQGYNDKEDLHQVGVIGLMKAYKNFDKARDVKFSTYAFPYIVGEVSSYVRENKAIKVSRDMIRLGRKINEYIDKHIKVRGYAPTVSDIALMLDAPEEKIISALDACRQTKSLDEEINNEGKTITLLDVTPKKETLSKDVLLDLKEAFSYLSDEEKMLVENRYFKDLTQSEVAKIMDVNQVYVSRMEKKVLKKMKSKMTF